MERIEALREAALCESHCKDEFYYRFYKRYSESGEASEYGRYADAFYSAFSGLTPNVTDGELIVGEIKNNLTDSEREEWKTVYEPIAKARTARSSGGQDSHMAIDYELLLREGIEGVMAKIDGYLAGSTEESAEFYKAARTCLLAVISHSENYSAYACSLAEREPNVKRKAELMKIAEICAKVPRKPAESFYEAVQSVHFLTYCLTLDPLRLCYQQFQLGHPDRYLLPYYERDIKNGVITREEARLLLDLLGIQINMRVPNGLSSGYMVGGRDGEGRVVANELTEMLMQVIEDIRLVYPSVGLCYTDDMPEKYLELASEILSHGRSHPAIFNDDVITEGLQGYGVPERESHDYIHSTCVEITPTAASNVWVASPYTNMAKLLLDVMDREYESFDSLISAFFDHLDRQIEKNFYNMDAIRKRRADTSLTPLLSCFVNDCLKRGADIERGGARYNWIMPSFVGMANLVDSLYVLKTLVFDNREFTIKRIKEIVDNDFKGNETLRRRIIDDIPKYGNDIDEVDVYFGIITSHIISECKKYRSIHSGADLIPSVFCWVKHEYFGRETGATPDGRLAGFPLGDGSGPCQGREMNGPTASILSSTKWKHAELIGGVAVNMKFSKSSLGVNSVAVMQSLIKAYMRRGGFEIQINVTDRKILEKARQSPEEYRDLVVRIGGYSDYYTKLSPEMQNELILRTEHRI